MTRTSVDVVPPLPPSVPGTRSAFTRWLGRTVLRLGGWRVGGELPDVPRVVLIGAPHSSNWDGIWGLGAKMAIGLDVRILGKDSLFKVPLVGWMLRRLGVVPVDRNAPAGVIEQAVARLQGPEPFWFGLAPEGTRKRVQHWKTGFWKIADAAGVPVLPVYLHYPERTIGIGPLFHTSGDMEADMARIRAWYRPWQGKNRGTE